MSKVVFENEDMVVIHMDEQDEMDNVFAIANGSINVFHKDVKRQSPIYSTITVVPVSDEGFEDSYLIFSDVTINTEETPEVWEKLDEYWVQYKEDNREDFYDEEGNPW